MHEKISQKSQRNQQGFSHIVLFLLCLAALAFVGFAAYKVTKKTNTENKNNYRSNSSGQGVSQSTDSWRQKCTGNGSVQLSHVPMDISDIDTIVPLGSLAGAHVTPIDHLYFYPKNMQQKDAVPVYAMADGYVISREDRVPQDQNGNHSIRIVVQHTCSFYTYYDLMTSLDADIEAKLKNGDMHVPIKAGQVIGRVGGQSLDTAVYNLDLTLKGFVKPSSYEMEPWKIHTDDFFKYFSGKNKEDMLALNPRKAEPRSGKIDYDIEGRLIGNWFEEGTNGYAGPKDVDRSKLTTVGYFSGHLSIAPDAMDPTLINVSTGSYQGSPKQFTILKPSTTPDKVGEGQEIMYELITYKQPGPGMSGSGAFVSQKVLATALFKVLPNNKLKAEIFADKTAAQVTSFTDAAKVYER